MMNALPNSLYAAARSGRSPKYCTFTAIRSSAGFTASKSACGPDDMIAPSPLRAAAGPMNTGQCRYLTPCAFSRVARAAVNAGCVVV